MPDTIKIHLRNKIEKTMKDIANESAVVAPKTYPQEILNFPQQTIFLPIGICLKFKNSRNLLRK